MTGPVVTIAYAGITAYPGTNCETLLTKRIWMDADGTLQKLPAAKVSDGEFTPLAHTGTADQVLAEVANVLRSLSSSQAIIASPLPQPYRSDGKKFRLRLKQAKDDGTSLARSQDTFRWTSGPALMPVDFDMPPRLRASVRTADELRENVLLPAWPGFADVAMLIRPSVSSGAKFIRTPDPVPSGFHVFLLISDGKMIPVVTEALFDRLALNGWAVVEASRRGAALQRALVDVSVGKGPERLLFEADPVLGDGVERVGRPIAQYGGGTLDAQAGLVGLTLSGDEHRDLKRIWAEVLTKAKPDLEAARAKWLEGRGAEIAEKHEVDPKEGRSRAQREAARFDAGELRDDFPIHLNGGEWVTVYQILSDPDRYVGARCWSLDEKVSRPGVGFIQPYPSRPDPSVGKPAGPWLHSFEHGGRYFRLRSVKAECERIELLRGAQQLRQRKDTKTDRVDDRR